MSVLPTQAASRQALLAGIGLKVLSIFLFGVMNALVKWLAADYGIMQLVFFRSAFALLPLALVVRQAGGLSVLRTGNVKGHLARSLVGTASIWCYFVGFSLLPLAEANAILFAAPLFMTALSVPLLGERVGWRRWTAVIVGFSGVLIMLQPTGSFSPPGVLACLGGAVLSAFAINFVRLLSRTEKNITIVFWFSVTGALIAGVLMLPEWITPGPLDFLLLASIGVIGGCAQLAMTAALRHAPVAVVVPFDYTAMIWSVMFGYLIWGDLPGTLIWIGSAIVVASGLYILYRETRVSREKPVLTGDSSKHTVP